MFKVEVVTTNKAEDGLMTKLKMTTLAAALLTMGLGSTVVLADGNGDDGHKGDVAYDNYMTRRAPGSTSGSGHTVEAECPTDPSGNDWQGATAELKVEQSAGKSTVKVEVEGAVPDTVFTVWMRVQGGAGWNRDVNGFAGSPLTGGGATPLIPGTLLDSLAHYSPWADPLTGGMPQGSDNPTNGFVTDSDGEGEFEIDLDFPLIGGSYPFYKAVTPEASRPGREGRDRVGYAIPTPLTSPGTPFLLRVISHCQDGYGHGLLPSVPGGAGREAWFEIKDI
jgi:hypothetical protein